MIKSRWTERGGLSSLRRLGAPVTGVTLFTFSLSLFPPRVAHAQPAPQLVTEAPEVATNPIADEPEPEGEPEVSVDSAHAAAQAQVNASQNADVNDVKAVDPKVPSTPPTGDTQTPLALPTGADKSGVTSKSISVPKGSGTIQGLGESFSAQLSTGIATFSVPLALPAARGGAQPSLGLSYSSSGGFGLAGAGWSIGVPFIARQTDRGVPKFDDQATWHPEQDRFVFNGGQELVPICTVSGTSCNGAVAGEEMPVWGNGWQYFRPRVEGSFLRFFWSPNHLTWRVQDKSGVTMELGVPLDGSGYSQAVERNPDLPLQGGEIYRWHLVRQYDTYGAANPTSGSVLPANVIAYRYFQDGGSAYLSDIYDTPPATGGVAVAAVAPLSTYAHHTRLAYETRTDPTASYRSGWKMEQRLRLKSVDVASKAYDETTSAARHLVRRYHLAYETSSHVSLLESVQVEGRCESEEVNAKVEVNEQLPATNCPRLPAMTFAYEHVEPFKTNGSPGVADLPGYEGFDERLITMTASPPHSVDEEQADLFDVNSDALPDVLVTAAGVYGPAHGVFFNGASGTAASFGAAKPMGINGVLGAGATTITLKNQNVAPLDLDGDATVDLLHMPKVKTYAVYSPKELSNGWVWQGREVTTSSGNSPKIDLGKDALDTQVMDVDFDGLVDVVVTTGTEVQTFFALGRYSGGDGRFGSGKWTSKSTATLSDEPVRTCVPWSATPVRFSDPDIKVSDMNGDGIADIVRVRPGDIRYWPGRGNGFWGTGKRDDCGAGTFGANRHVVMNTGPQYSDIQGESLRFDDVNGDGLTDLVQVRFMAVDVWLNVDGVSWTKRHIIENTPASPSYANRVRLADANGSGTRDVLWGNASNYQYMDLAGGRRPWILTRVDNGLGKTTDLEYSTSTAEMLAAQKAGNPWQSRTPSVVHLVKRTIENENIGISGNPARQYKNEYSYRNPVYDGRQREFRGFRSATATKLGDVNSPTDVTESTFLLGECVDESDNGKNECGVAYTWMDNPREALKGLPVLTESRDAGSTYSNTAHTTYTLRHLYSGLDGRAVRHAFESAKDTYLYDVGAFTPASSTVTMADVKVEFDGSGPDASLQVDSSVSLRSTTGRRRIQSANVTDFFGNRTHAIAYGCTEGCADETITTETLPTRPAGDPTGWLWRTGSSRVSGTEYFLGDLKVAAFGYSANGALDVTRYAHSGIVALDRFHASGSAFAAAPSDASTGAAIDSTNTYTDFGNLERETGPNGRCRDLDYSSDPYETFPSNEFVYTGGCNTAPLSSGADYDRGFGVAVSVTNIQSQTSTIEYDGFGRLIRLTKPNPTSGAVGAYPSVKIEYFLPPDLTTNPSSPVNFSMIHTETEDGATIDGASYLESWSFVDGMGRTLATFSEAEADNTWIVSGQVAYDAKGAVQKKFLEKFELGAPGYFDVSADPGTDYGTQSYNAFGQPILTTDLDGTITLAQVHHALSVDMKDAEDLKSGGSHEDTYATEQKDGHGRTVRTTERFAADARDTFTTYLPTGEPQVIRRELDSTNAAVVRWMRYDSLGRMVLNVEPNTTTNFTDDYESLPSNLHAWRYVYNDAGDLVGTSDARGCGVNFEYDGAGRLKREDYSPCQLHHLTYSAPNTSAWTGIEVEYVYDAAPGSFISNSIPTNYFSGINSNWLKGQLVGVYDMGAISISKVDGRGRVIGNARRMAKPGIFSSSLGDRYTEHWFEKTTAYDAADREVSATTGATVTELLGSGSASEVTTTYSTRGTVASAAGSYGTLVASTTRDADGLMRVITYGDAASTETLFGYDERRRVTSIETDRGIPSLWTSPPGNYLPAPTYTASPPYFLPGHQTELQHDEIVYDDVSNPISIDDMRDEAQWPSDAKPVDRTFEYDDFYRVTEAAYTYNNGSTWTSPFAPENAGATDPRLGKPVGQVSFTNRIALQTYTYDWLGNTATSDDDQDGFYDRSLGAITNSTSKPYQLSSASNETTPGSPINNEGHLTALYDAAGNLIELRVLRNGTCIPSGSNCNQVFEYRWDEVGRLVRARRWDVTAANINTAISALGTESAETINTFDASDERTIEETTFSGTTKQNVYVFDSLELRRTVAVTSGSPPVTDYTLDRWTEVPYLFVNGARLARIVYHDTDPEIAGNETHVFLELGDHLGSTSAVLDKVTGELVEKGTYQPYGAAESDYRPDRWQEFREDYRFTGKEEDVQVGLTYFGKRFLSPYLNRWVSADPLAIHGLGADPNVYAYVSGQALKATDPLGLESVCEGGACRSESSTEPANQSVDASSTSYNQCGSGGCKSTFSESDMAAYRDGNRRRVAESDKPLETPPIDPIDLMPVGGGIRVVGKVGVKVLGRKAVAKVGAEIAEDGAAIVAKKAEGAVAESVLKESAETAAETAFPKSAAGQKAAAVVDGVVAKKSGGKAIALGKDIPGGGLKALADKTGASWWRNWARDGITRRTVDRHFGRAFHQASKRADRIHFSLDGIADPAAAVRRGAAGFKPGNFTNAELNYIANNPELLGKTLFYRGGSVVASPF